MTAARNYTSTALPTTLASALGSSGNPVVEGLPGTWPTAPFAVLIDWATPEQEVVLVTGAPTGSGPYTLPCTRGIDGTTAQTHGAGAVVVHGITSYEPTLLQTDTAAITTLQGQVPSALPVPVNQGGTNATSAGAALTSLGAASASALTAETSRAEAAEALLAPLASPALTGTPSAPTATALTDSTQVATTAYADSAVAVETTRAEAAEVLLAPLASPALTGTPTAPTKTALTNNTDIATTAYADAAVAVETSRAETAEALALPKTGGTMSGAIAMGTSKITGLGNGSGAQDAAAFGQIPLIDASAGDIAALGSQAAGSTGKTADAGHVHPTTGVVLTSSLPLAISSGGTGTATGAPQNDVFAGPTSGTGAPAFRALVAGDLPTGTTGAKGALQLDGTATDIATLGAQSAGSSGLAADAAHIHPSPVETPGDRSYIAWTFDPKNIGAEIAMGTFSSGTLFLTKVILRKAATVATVTFYLGNQIGTTLTSGQNFIGLYDSGGTLRASTADQTAAWTTSGNKNTPQAVSFTGSYSAAAGFYWIGFLTNYTGTGSAVTPFVAVSNAGNSGAVNLGLTAATSCAGFLSGSGTSLPGTITPSGIGIGHGGSWPVLAALS